MTVISSDTRGDSASGFDTDPQADVAVGQVPATGGHDTDGLEDRPPATLPDIMPGWTATSSPAPNLHVVGHVDDKRPPVSGACTCANGRWRRRPLGSAGARGRHRGSSTRLSATRGHQRGPVQAARSGCAASAIHGIMRVCRINPRS